MKKHIEEWLSSLLQCNIQFVLGTKTIKQGKLLVYSVKDYIISFTIRNNKNQLKVYDVYYPYEARLNKKKQLVFDYSIDTLVSNKLDLVELISQESEDIKNHKIFDSELLIIDADAVTSTA